MRMLFKMQLTNNQTAKNSKIMEHMILTAALLYIVGVVAAFTLFYVTIDPQDKKNQEKLTNISLLSWLAVLIGICIIIEDDLEDDLEEDEGEVEDEDTVNAEAASSAGANKGLRNLIGRAFFVFWPNLPSTARSAPLAFI